MVFKLLQSAEKRWKRIKGFSKLEMVVNNIRFQGEMRSGNRLRRYLNSLQVEILRCTIN